MDGQFDLPKEIIQHIQSFLSGKEAASTAVLCKSWYNSWLTRPCLDFDERCFQEQNSDGEFFDFVKRSIQRYRGLNLGIDSFKLWMNVRDTDSYSLATALIAIAVKMGANCINIEFNSSRSEYRLPEEVFAAKSLVGLSVVGCRILGGQIMCSRLNSLRLCKVRIGDNMIKDIMLKCPLIENVYLSDCKGLLKVDLSKMVKLKSFSFIRQDMNTPVALREPLIEFEDQSVGLRNDDRIIVSKFSNLSHLLLDRVRINWMLFSDFSKNFPCLEDLRMSNCSGCRIFNISSSSLKYISLEHLRKLYVELDVPNIRRFDFLGCAIPSLSLVTSSSQWESDITFVFFYYLDTSLFLEMKNFLMNLKLSKIFLSISLFKLQSIDFVPQIQDFPKPVVEDLNLIVNPFTPICHALFDGIFWSCRPKSMTQNLFLISDNECEVASNEPLHLLCKKLMDQENHNSIENMIGWHELEEAKAEYYEPTLMKWRPLPWQALHLLDALGSPDKGLWIRFWLTWRTT